MRFDHTTYNQLDFELGMWSVCGLPSWDSGRGKVYPENHILRAIKGQRRHFKDQKVPFLTHFCYITYKWLDFESEMLSV